MKTPIRQIVITCTLGYILIAASAVTVSVIVGLVTGYFPSFTFFTLALITFRFFELHPVFLIAPLLFSVFAMMLLSKTSINTKIAAGLGIASYYLMVGFIYLISGAGDFPIEVAIPWILWAFILGYTSSVMVGKLKLNITCI